MKPEPLVRSQPFAALQLDDRTRSLAEVLGDELVELHLTQEADPLRVLAVGVGKIRGGGDCSNLRLRQTADWKRKRRQLCLREMREEVRLVLVRIPRHHEPHGVGCVIRVELVGEYTRHAVHRCVVSRRHSVELARFVLR